MHCRARYWVCAASVFGVLLLVVLGSLPAPGVEIITNLDDSYLDIDPNYLKGAVEGAAQYWMGTIQDGNTLTVNYWWDDLGGNTLAGYQGTNWDGATGRVTECNIIFDSKYEDESTREWSYSADDSQFDLTQVLYRDLTEGQRGDWYAGNPPNVLEVSYAGQATASAPTQVKEAHDLFSVALHELGHALGLDPNIVGAATQYSVDPDLVRGANMSVTCYDSDPVHLADANALMYPTIGPGLRRYPSATDVLAIASASQWGEINLYRKDFLGGSDWNEPNNWVGAICPDANRDAYIHLPDANISLSADGYARNLTVAGANVQLDTDSYTLHVTQTATIGEGGLLYLNGGELEANILSIVNGGHFEMAAGTSLEGEAIYVGHGSDGNFVQSGGTVDTALYVGNGAGGVGYYKLAGGVLQGNAKVGCNGGVGTLVQTGGDYLYKSITVGSGANSFGTYSLTDGNILTSLVIDIGFSDGNGVFDHVGGTVMVSILRIGRGAGAAGRYSLGDGNLYVTEDVPTWVGYGGAGTFVQNGGLHQTPVLGIGMDSNEASYELGGGKLVTGSTKVGCYDTDPNLLGRGQFTQTGGTHSTGSLGVSHLPGQPSSYALQDGNLVVSGNTSVAGVFTHDAIGIHTVGGYLSVDAGPNCVGTYDLQDGNLSVSGNCHVGWWGSGTLLQSGGTHTVGGSLRMATSSGSDGNYTMSGGTLAVDGNICIGGGESSAGGDGWMHITGGTATVGGVVKVWSSGTLNLGGGTLQYDDSNLHVDIENDDLFRITSGSHTVGSVLSVDPNLLGTTQLDANTALSVTKIVQDTVTIGASATLTIRGASASTTVVYSLWIDANNDGVLDLDDSNDLQGNCLVLPGADYATVAEWVRSGRNDGAGVWDGPGIITSVGQDSSTFVAVGVIDNAQFEYSTFGDATGLDGNEVLLKCTWLGDADLDGDVDTFDLLRWVDGYNGEGSGWSYGDFDYDGDTDNWDQLYWMDGYDAYSEYGQMPEPASAALLALGAGLELSRRRKRYRHRHG